jgi:GDP-L-fucose synthase
VEVTKFFQSSRIDVVVIAAAKVGGIHANAHYRADFIFDNLAIQNNLIWNAHLHGCKRLIFLGSSCIYPRLARQPMSETELLEGQLEYTNRPYAIAKISGLELVDAIRIQYGKDFFSVMPTNLYGPGDNFHPTDSHVIPALLRRFHEAKLDRLKQVVVWGSGQARREFMYSEDCAEAIVHLLETFDSTTVFKEKFDNRFSHINIGTGTDVSIRDLALTCKEVSGFDGEVLFDATRPEGTPRKLLDVSLLHSLGWQHRTGLKEGLKTTFDWFVEAEKKGAVRL